MLSRLTSKIGLIENIRSRFRGTHFSPQEAFKVISQNGWAGYFKNAYDVFEIPPLLRRYHLNAKGRVKHSQAVFYSPFGIRPGNRYPGIRTVLRITAQADYSGP